MAKTEDYCSILAIFIQKVLFLQQIKGKKIANNDKLWH